MAELEFKPCSLDTESWITSCIDMAPWHNSFCHEYYTKTKDSNKDNKTSPSSP